MINMYNTLVTNVHTRRQERDPSEEGMLASISARYICYGSCFHTIGVGLRGHCY